MTTNSMTAAQTVLDLLRSTRTPLTVVATGADVPYGPLYRWVNSKKPRKYDVVCAERIYTHLTGNTFISDK